MAWVRIYVHGTMLRELMITTGLSTIPERLVSSETRGFFICVKGDFEFQNKNLVWSFATLSELADRFVVLNDNVYETFGAMLRENVTLY